MPGPATNAGSAAGAVLEGFLSGVQQGSDFRRQRTFDAQDAEEIKRRRIADQVAEGRAGAAEGRAVDRAAREDISFDADLADRGLARGAGPDFSQGTGTGFAPVERLRRGVSETISAQGPAAPPGTHRIGPSADEREDTERAGFRRQVAEFMALSPEDRAIAAQDPSMQRALDELNQFGDVFDDATAIEDPASVSPLQRVTGQGGREFTFNPRGEPGERIAPLLGPGGTQFISRQPADNFARSNAQAAVQAISRIDRLDFFGDDEAVAAEAVRVAQMFGFDSVEQAQQILSSAVSGDGGNVSAPDPFEPLLEQILGSNVLSDEEKAIAQEIADDPDLEGQRSELLRNLLGNTGDGGR